MTVQLRRLVTNRVVKDAAGTRPLVNLDNVEGGTARLLLPSDAEPTVAGQNLAAEPGDVLFAKLRPYLRKSLLVTEPVFASGEFLCLRPSRDHLHPEWLLYLTQSDSWISYATASAYGSKMPRTSWDEMSTYGVNPPDLSDQMRAVEYLNDQCSRIDEAISLRQEQSLALSERHRVAVREMVAGRTASQFARGTALPWLGPVEATWTRVRLSRISRFYSGTTFPHAYQGQSTGTLPFVKVSDFGRASSDLRLGEAENWITPEVGRILGARVAPEGSIAFARVGAALLLNQRRLLTKDSVVDDNVRAVLVGGHAAYYLHLLCLVDFGELANPGPVPSVTESQIGSITVPMPPPAVQQQIGDAIDRASCDVADARGHMAAQIDLLRQRRRALISAAIAGEIDMTTASGRGV